MVTADELINELPKGLLKWHDFDREKKALYISAGTKIDDSLFHALKECCSNAECADAQDLDNFMSGKYSYTVVSLAMDTTRRAFPPLLKFEIIRLSRIIGDYFKWQVELEQNIKKYEKRVLFGAGNMCRNYMKCYGEKYPPLFTCDNNSKLWGTSFEGLAVKSPEELKNLPKDCCVVICNIYYREIESQLRGMGIENIGYFNDEYMPSFYFDRVERENV